LSAPGPDGKPEGDQLWWDAFDLKVKGECRHSSEGGAFMIAQTRYQVAHRGLPLGYATISRCIGLPLALVIPFRDRLVAGERFYYDLATLLKQIGVLPTLEANNEDSRSRRQVSSASTSFLASTNMRTQGSRCRAHRGGCRRRCATSG
jgi:hypothetical protein